MPLLTLSARISTLETLREADLSRAFATSRRGEVDLIKQRLSQMIDALHLQIDGELHSLSWEPALLEALGWFVDDKRFQVGVGGNPNVVAKMIADAKDLYELVKRDRELRGGK